MKVVYISGPISAPTEWERTLHTLNGARLCAELWKMDGISPICPHLNSAFMGGLVSYDKFIAGDLAVLDRCDGIVMMPGWGNSNGANIERSRALGLGMPVFYWPLDQARLVEWGLKEKKEAA